MGKFKHVKIDEIEWFFFQSFEFTKLQKIAALHNFLHDLPWNHEICIYAQYAHPDSIFGLDYDFFHHIQPSRFAKSPPNSNYFLIIYLFSLKVISSENFSFLKISE